MPSLTRRLYRHRDASITDKKEEAVVPSLRGKAFTMQTVALGLWGDVTIYASGDSLPTKPGTAIPDQVRSNDRFRPALLRTRALRPLPYIAVWPEQSRLFDARSQAAPWTCEELFGVVLAQWARGWRCRVCDGRVDALQADATVPFFSDHLRRHRWATCCPHCRAHVDRAKLHAMMIWPADAADGVA